MKNGMSRRRESCCVSGPQWLIFILVLHEAFINELFSFQITMWLKLKNKPIVLIILFLAILTFFVLTRNATLTNNIQAEQYQDENGTPFLYGGADAYYFFRLAQNLDQYGMLGNTIEDDGYGRNVSKDSLRFFPSKDVPPKTIFPYALLYFFKIWQKFNPAISLIKTTAYFPVFLGILSVILIFLIAKKITGTSAGILAAIIFAIHPIFLYNNYRGYADTHVFAQTWMLLTILCLFFVLEYKNNKTAIFAASIMLFLLFFAKLAWSGLAIIQLIFVIFFIILIAQFVFNKKLINNKLKIALFLIAICTLLFAIAIFFEEFFIKAINMLVQKPQSFFPNAFSFVAELQGAKNVLAFFSYFGGFFMICFFLGIFSFFVEPAKNKNQTIFLFIWLIAFILPAFSAARILFFLLPPFAIICGRGLKLAADTIFDILCEILQLQKKQFNITLPLIKASILFLMILIIFLASNPFTVQMPQQLITRSISDAARFIEANSSPNAVILTWWDLGYAWQALSNRATFFDGGLFNTPRLFWTSKAFDTDNEKIAANSLRLMSCDSDNWLNSFGPWAGSSPEKITQFYRILASKQRKDANIIANELCISLNQILCNKQHEIFLAVTEEMLYQMPFFEHYSNWDFKNAKSMISKLEPAIIDRPSKCKNQNNNILCENGAIADIISLNATIKGVHPKSFVFVKNQKTTSINYADSTLNFSIIIYTTVKNEYHSILVDNKLLNKIAFRLFTGQKIDNFEQVFISDETPQRIAVYKLLPQEHAIAPFVKEHNNSQMYFFIPKDSRGKSIVLRNVTIETVILNPLRSAQYLVVNANKNKTKPKGPYVLDAQEIYYYDSNEKLVKSEIIPNKMLTENVLRIIGNFLCPLY